MPEVATSPIGRVLPPVSAQAVHWRLDPSTVFLNHGSFGATPAAVLSRQREIQDLMEREPVRFFVEIAPGLMQAAHRAVADLIGADEPGVVRVENATAGVNAVVGSLRLSAGDELLTSTHEYNACNNALRRAAAASGAKVVTAGVPFPIRREQEAVDAVLAGVTSRTRLVLISHVTSPTGLVMPVGRIVEELNRCGIESLVDGAHAPGMLPLDIARLNPTYYTGNFHKWLCAPKGAAFLWVRQEKREGPDAVRPPVVSHGANAALGKGSTRLKAEFDYCGTADMSAYFCVPECVRFLGSLHAEGVEGQMRANREKALRGRELLCRVLGVEPGCPERMIGALASVALPDPPGGVIRPSLRGYHDRLWDALIERHGIQAPVFPFPPAEAGVVYGPLRPQTRLVRIAMQAYNTLEQVEYLGACLKEELERERWGDRG
jgi:isopenicillin-N epimerase